MAGGNIERALGRLYVVPKFQSLSPEEQLRNAIEDSGLIPPDRIILDGLFHRFHGDKKKDYDGWYKAFGDNIPAGAFGSWRAAIKSNWRADVDRELTTDELAQLSLRYQEANKEREKERKKIGDSVAESAIATWENCPEAPSDHPYLILKGIKPHNTRVTVGDNRLVIPIYNAEDEMVNLQYIHPPHGKKKRFITGGIKEDNFTIIGIPGKTIYITEGFATGASVYEASGEAVCVAFDAGNLLSVTGIIRKKFGKQQEIVIVGDNDKSQKGQIAAKAAADKHNCRVVIPPIVGYDANDYAYAGHDLLEILKPKLGEWLIPFHNFCTTPHPINWLIKHWVQSNALIMVHGPSGGGKTFVVLNWALMIAAGLQDWSGHRVRKGNVVYLAGEGHHGLHMRLAAWRHHHQVKDADLWLSKSGCELNTPEGLDKVKSHVRSLPIKPDLIIIDTLHRFLAGDENSSQDAGSMLNACSTLMQEFDCSVLLVHHTGLAEGAQHRARGSSAWRGALDVEISVTSSGKDGPIKLSQQKQKDASEADDIWVELKDVVIPGWLDEDGEEVKSAVVVDSTEPVKPKKDSKLTTFKRLFERAWHQSYETVTEEGIPYVTRSAMMDFLIRNLKNSENTAKQNVKPSETERVIGYLLNSEIIKHLDNDFEEVGWKVIDNTFISALLLTVNK